MPFTYYFSAFVATVCRPFRALARSWRIARNWLLLFVPCAVVACGGSTETTEQPDAACTSGFAPPPGGYCHPCEEVLCPCPGLGEGISRCNADGSAYGECVLPGDAGTCNASPCGITPECPSCSDGQCCNVDEHGNASAGVCQ